MRIMAGHSRANSVLNGELKKQSPDSALNSLPPASLQCVPCGRRRNPRCSVWSIGGFFVYLRYSRTAVLALALINQVLSSLGKPLLPIESAQLEQLISTGFTTVSALVNWWFNNSFTKEAIQADAEFERLRKSVK